MKYAAWDNEAVVDYIIKHDPQAYQNFLDKHDKEMALETAKKMLAKNKPVDEIIEFTGLTKEEILALQVNNNSHS